MNKVTLTVADHEKNGFVYLAQWVFPSQRAALAFITYQDEIIEDEAEPDILTVPFTFMLDLIIREDIIATGAKCLPMQNAMALAPQQVQNWLNEQPEPDDWANNEIPLLGV